MLKLAIIALLGGAAFADSCLVKEGNHTYDLSKIPVVRDVFITSSDPADPSFGGTFPWSVSLCELTSATEARSCYGNIGYIFQYQSSVGPCSNYYNGNQGAWKWERTGATRMFTNLDRSGSNLLVTVRCDRDAVTLLPDGPAVGGKGSDRSWLFAVTFRSNVVCPPLPPAPAPGPHGFHYCDAATPAKAVVHGETSGPVALLGAVGSRLACPCFTATTNGTGADVVELSVACSASPTGPFLHVADIDRNGMYSAGAQLRATCPVQGYFSIMARNPNRGPSVVEYGARCTVNGKAAALRTISDGL